MKTANIFLLAVFNGLFACSSAAQTWTQTSAPSNSWRCLASSADGCRLAAGATSGGIIYVSTNSGATWAASGAPSATWYSIASSADGTKLLAAAPYVSGANSGGIYTSTNSGVIWTLNNLPYEFWSSVASSADGSKLIAVAPMDANGSFPGAVFVSTNAGNNWVSNSVHGISAAASADGTKLFIVFLPNVWRSTNSGATWTQIGATFLNGGWAIPSQEIASSADGEKLILALFSDINNSPGPIYTSTNAGDSWELTTAPSNRWSFVASSADGNTLLAVPLLPGGFDSIYVSTNSGATWTTNNSPNMGWGAVASSADGGRLVAGAAYDSNYNDSGIFAAQLVRSPWLDIAQANNNLALSWLIPSTNFVLQQSSDLSSWMDLTNQPLLNLTTLQNEVSLPLPGSNAFFRLKTP